MNTLSRRHRESVIRTPDVPTLAQMVRDGQASAARIKRASVEALAEWFGQSQRLHIARTHYDLRGGRFVDFARRIGVDRSSAFQLVKLRKHKTAILSRCQEENRFPGWETCLYWFEHAPRRWPPQTPSGRDTDERGTPAGIFDRFGRSCTLDVAASPTTAQCSQFFTKRNNGLKKPWHGVVWLNPPYSDPAPWCKKAVAYARAGGKVIGLLPAWTDAPWFHEYVSLGQITFLRRRLAFIGASGSAPFPSIIVEWTPGTVSRGGETLYAILDQA
jgi:phage N-6-adenine-methyltransferase